MPSSSSFALLALGLLGFWGTWGRSGMDGTLEALDKALGSSTPHVLAGTKSLLRTSFTGIKPVDHQLRVLIVFWWEAVDGSHPAASAISLYFLGQFFGILMAMHADGLRAGNARKLGLSPLMWVTLFQLLTVGSLGPLWAFVYLASSPLLLRGASSLSEARTLSTAPQLKMLCLPLALILGYLLPAVFMALPSPSIVSNDFQQKAIAVWNFFPLWVWPIQKSLEMVFSALGSGSRKASTVESQRAHLMAVRLVDAVGIAVSSGTHIIFLSLTVATRLFPTIFAKGYASQLSFNALFVPPIAIEQVETVGDGVRGFLMWDQVVGYTVFLGVFGYQFLSAARLKHYEVKTVTGALLAAFSAVTVGPGATVLGLSWARDELLFAGDQGAAQSSSNKAPSLAGKKTS